MLAEGVNTLGDPKYCPLPDSQIASLHLCKCTCILLNWLIPYMLWETYAKTEPTYACKAVTVYTYM